MSFHTCSLTMLEPKLTEVAWRPLNFSRDTQSIAIFFNGTQGIPPIVCTRLLRSRVRRVRDPSRLILLLWEDKGQVSEEVMCWTRQDGGWLLSVVTCESHRNGAIFKFLLPVERSDFRMNVFFFLSKNTLRGLLYEHVIFNVSLELWLCNKLIIIHDAIRYSLCP